MKIAFIYKANDPYVNTRVKYLINRGHEVYYFILPQAVNQPVPEGIKCIPIKPSALSNIMGLRRFSLFYPLRHLTQKYQIDILHIINMRYSKYALFSKSKKVVIENEGSDVLFYPNLKHGGRLKASYRFLYRFADAVIQDSKISQDAGIRYGASVLNNQVIEVGVDFKIFNLEVKKNVARERLSLSENQKIVFSSRSFREIYNIDIIIKTIPFVKRQFPDVRYVFCGLNRDLEGEYKQIASQLNVSENTLFVGVLDNGKDLPFFYRDADVVVSVPTSDSSPLSVYEALACGTPVIISELPWYHQRFKNNRELIAVPVRDVEKLASAILDILKKRIVLYLESSYKKVFEFFNYETENQKLETLYKQILDGKS